MEFGQASLTPVQVFVFFLRRLLHAGAERLGACAQRLAAIQALRRDFPGVVDSHQAGDVRNFGFVELVIGNVTCRVIAGGRGGAYMTGIEAML